MYAKPLIIGTISILAVMLIYSTYSSSAVFAIKKVRDTIQCEADFFADKCCWTEWLEDDDGVFIPGSRESWCQTCVDTDGDNVGDDCDPPVIQRRVGGPFAQPEFPSAPLGGVFQSQPSGPAIPPGGGVLETEPTAPSGPAVPPGNVGTLQNQSAPGDPFATPNSGGVFNTPQTGGVFKPLSPTDEGAAGAPPPVDEAAPPVDEDTQPPTLMEEGPPVCPEGQVLVEESDLCVLEDCPEGQILDEESGLCVLEEPEAAEEEPAPLCQEGLVLDKESNLCVLEEPEAAEDEPEQVEIDEPEQQSSEGDGSQDNGNNDNN